MYQFRGLIKCLNCSKNYRGKMERKKVCYVCSGWSNKGSDFCERFRIDEEELLLVTKMHLNREVEEGDVDKIEVKDKTITIYYSDNTQSIIKPSSVIF